MRRRHGLLAVMGLVAGACHGRCATTHGPPPATGPRRAVARLVLAPPRLVVPNGCAGRFSVRAEDVAGRPLVRTVAWTADGPLTIDGDGRFVASAPGTATVTAAFDDVRATAIVVATDAPCPSHADVFVDLSAPRQTMIGLEANAQNGSVECPREAYLRYREELWDRAIDEMGIDRIRLEFRANFEHERPLFAEMQRGDIAFEEWHRRAYEAENDDSDPDRAAPGRFHFEELDNAIEQTVLPLRERLRERGRALYLNLCYVNFEPASEVHRDPDEYAELVHETFAHIHGRYGFVPDSLEVHLEPDTHSTRDADQIANNLVAAVRRLARAGWHPDVVAPSTANMSIAVGFFDRMIQVPGVPEALTELSYHRYGGVRDGSLANLRRRAARFGLRTGMLEHMGSDHLVYETDVVDGVVSTWTLLGLSFCEGYNGGDYYTAGVEDPKNPSLVVAKNARYLPQYSRDVHRGAVRYEARTEGDLFALAFVNPPDGKHAHARWTVVIRSEGDARTVRVGPLPPAKYRASVTTETRMGEELGAFEPEIGVVTIAIPAGGVVTLAGLY